MHEIYKQINEFIMHLALVSNEEIKAAKREKE